MNDSMPQLFRFLQQENARLQAENQSLREECQALRRYLTALQELSWAAQQLTSEQDLIHLLDGILYHAMRLVKAGDGSVLLRDAETDELVFAVVHGDIEGQLRGHRIPASTGIAGWVAAEGDPVIANHPREDWRFSSKIDESFGFLTRSLICVPMITIEKVVGVIELLNKQDDAPFVEADATLLSILGHVAANALETMRVRIEAEEAQPAQ